MSLQLSLWQASLRPAPAKSGRAYGMGKVKAGSRSGMWKGEGEVEREKESRRIEKGERNGVDGEGWGEKESYCR